MRANGLMMVAALALAAAACNNTDAGNDLSTDTNLAEDAAVNDVLGADALGRNQAGSDALAEPMSAAGFANAVAASDLFEIETAKIAAGKSGSAEVKAFAQHLITDHERSSAELKAAAAKASPPLTVTPALDAEKQAMLDQLKAANGPDFDRRFIDQQTNAHQQALLLLRNYVGGGQSQPLKDFASRAITAVEGHLEHLNSIRQ
jgi:putative membrane protein